MRQHAVAVSALGGQVRGNIRKAALGHANRCQPLNGGGHLHGLHGPLATHRLHLTEHNQEHAHELRVVLVGKVPLLNNALLDQLLKDLVVLAGVLAEVLHHLQEGVDLLLGQLQIANGFLDNLFGGYLVPGVDHAKGSLSGVVGLGAGDCERLLVLGLFGRHVHAARQGHDSFICHDGPFRFVPKASRAARRERTR